MKTTNYLVLTMILMAFFVNAQNVITVNPGDNLQTAINNASGGDTIEINGGTYGPIAIENRSFTQNNPLIIKAGTSKPTIQSNSSSTGRTVSLKNSKYVVLDGLIMNRGNYGIRANNSDNIIVINCEIKNTGQEGIQSNDDADFWDIINTKIHHTGLSIPKWGEGIYMGRGSGGSSNIWIEGCEIWECGLGEGINIKANECRFVTVRNNYVHDIHPGGDGQFNGAAISVDQVDTFNDGVHREIWIENNTIENVSGGGTSNTGIMVQEVGAYIVGNTIKNCTDYGIWFNDFGASNFATEYWNNTFINNGQNLFFNSNADANNTNPGQNPFSKQGWYSGSTPNPPTPPQGNGGLPVIAWTASSDNGNIPENTYDNDLGTRWSADGSGEWLQHELDDEYLVKSVDIAFYQGNQRISTFDLQLSSDGSTWITVFSGSSSGNTLAFENFDFTDKNARYVRYLGYGNSQSTWNSLTELRINGSAAQQNVSVTGVTVSPTSLTLSIGQTSSLIETVTPSNATDTSVNWSSNNTSVATVNNNGVVTAVAQGNATITVTTTDGGFTANTIVTVSGSSTPSGNGGLPVTAWTASANDGNIPENTYDNDLNTRWSADGSGQWLMHKLDNVYVVTDVDIAFYNGNQRSSSFDIQISLDASSWTTVYSGSSSGNSLNFESFNFSDTYVRYVRYVGYGNTANSWNSITEFRINGFPAGLPVIATTASADDGNGPENTYDWFTSTRWSANGSGQWLQHELDNTYQVESLDISFYNGNQRSSTFDIQVSTDASNWTTVFSGSSSGNTTSFENFDVTDQNARYVRYLGYGNSQNSWNSIVELKINGSGASSSKSIDKKNNVQDLNANNNFLKVHPNPVLEGKLFVELDSWEKTKLKLFNINGKLIFEKDIINKQEVLDVSNLSEGIYLLEIESPTRRTLKKIIR